MLEFKGGMFKLLTLLFFRPGKTAYGQVKGREYVEYLCYERLLLLQRPLCEIQENTPDSPSSHIVLPSNSKYAHGLLLDYMVFWGSQMVECSATLEHSYSISIIARIVTFSW